jgi:indolepyruvate ferredoxin oxidoreductase beta subunit
MVISLEPIEAVRVLRDYGSPIYSNVIMVGALSGTRELPITVKVFEKVFRRRMPEDKVALNINAFEIGCRLVKP